MPMLLTQNHACLLKSRGIKRNDTVGVISKLESYKKHIKKESTDLESSKHHSSYTEAIR